MKQHDKHAPTQAVWRFLNNDHAALPKLIEPLQKLARNQTDSPYTLAVIDGSRINYYHHESKTDRVKRTHQHDDAIEQ